MKSVAHPHDPTIDSHTPEGLTALDPDVHKACDLVAEADAALDTAAARQVVGALARLSDPAVLARDQAIETLVALTLDDETR